MSAAEDQSFDVVVFGAGVAGMSAALFAALRGRSAVVVEKAKTIGGTTALSAGTAWIPGTFHAASLQPVDTPALAARYLRAVVGNRLDERKLETFLANGPQAIAELHERTAVKFRPRPHHPDYFSDRDGAALRGRALEPLPFDGRTLGARLRLVRPPLDSLTLWGMMLTADDIKALLNAVRSPHAAWQSLRLVARHAADRFRHGRGTRLLMGNALCARLLSSLDEVGVPIWTETALSGLTVEGGRVTGATIRRAGTTLRLSARLAVVLATGGFAHSRRLQQIMLPQKLAPLTAMPEEVSGDGMECAAAQGAALGDAGGNGAFWAPISIHRRRDGVSVVYPHFFLDRGKPGVIAVDREGKRFVNEATSYDSFVRAMFAAGPACAPCFLIADGRAARAYGLGLMLPGFGRRRRLLADGYLRRANSMEALAGLLGIDPARLCATVDRFNRQAASGGDPDFSRGETAANQVLGDPAHKPNSCLGALATPPFYAVELHPGLNGTSTGLRTDERARVLRADGSAIGGLYACGNDMTSLMEGIYPGPGITIGPAIVFAYTAVTDMLNPGRKI